MITQITHYSILRKKSKSGPQNIEIIWLKDYLIEKKRLDEIVRYLVIGALNNEIYDDGKMEYILIKHKLYPYIRPVEWIHAVTIFQGKFMLCKLLPVWYLRLLFELVAREWIYFIQLENCMVM